MIVMVGGKQEAQIAVGNLREGAGNDFTYFNTSAL